MKTYSYSYAMSDAHAGIGKHFADEDVYWDGIVKVPGVGIVHVYAQERDPHMSMQVVIGNRCYVQTRNACPPRAAWRLSLLAGLGRFHRARPHDTPHSLMHSRCLRTELG